MAVDILFLGRILENQKCNGAPQMMKIIKHFNDYFSL